MEMRIKITFMLLILTTSTLSSKVPIHTPEEYGSNVFTNKSQDIQSRNVLNFNTRIDMYRSTIPPFPANTKAFSPNLEVLWQNKYSKDTMRDLLSKYKLSKGPNKDSKPENYGPIKIPEFVTDTKKQIKGSKNKSSSEDKNTKIKHKTKSKRKKSNKKNDKSKDKIQKMGIKLSANNKVKGKDDHVITIDNAKPIDGRNDDPQLGLVLGYRNDATNATKLIETKCGETYEVEKTTSLIMYTSNILGKSKCKLVLKTTLGNHLKITCPAFYLNTNGCDREQLLVKIPAGVFKQKFCSSQGPTKVVPVTPGNKMIVTYKRETKKPSAGFYCFVGVDQKEAVSPVTTTELPRTTTEMPPMTTEPNKVENTIRGPCSGCGQLPKGGSKATAGRGSNPWMVAVLLLLENDSVEHCGGAILSPQWIITAATCFTGKNINSVLVSLGDYDISTTDEADSKTYYIVRQAVHPGYFSNPVSENNNIALLELELKMEFSRQIQPICVADPLDDVDNKRGFVTGWNSPFFGGSISEKLQSVQVKMMNSSQCSAIYNELSVPTMEITDNMICSMSQGDSSCQGEDGSPLVSQAVTGQFVLNGIFNFAFNCGSNNYPAAHTKISRYASWINKITALDPC